jgi:hypothetical protein
MAGRIRSIKPEILEDKKTAGLSDSAFRLFIAMITLADDYGNLRGEPEYLDGQVWWRSRGDSRRVAAACREVSEAGLVVFYEVSGQTYAHLAGWTKHQRVDNAGKHRVPEPTDTAAVVVPQTSDHLAETRGKSRRKSASRGDLPLDPDLRSGSPTTIPTPSTTTDIEAAASAASEQGEVDEVAALWAEQENLRRSALPGCKPLRLTSDRRKRIAGLLDSGHEPADLRECLRSYADNARRDPSQGQWFNGDTNWRPDNVARTLGRIGSRQATSNRAQSQFDQQMERVRMLEDEERKANVS